MIKVAFISDLHGRHGEWETKMKKNGGWNLIEEADIIVFCGDMSGLGHYHEIENFLEWYEKSLPKVPKILIAGNHDYWWEKATRGEKDQMMSRFPGLTYLEDTGATIKGINFWGSPVSPCFRDWAFNRHRNTEGPTGIKAHWDMIPGWVDVLVVHGPPRGILDKVKPRFLVPGESPHVGCDELLDAIERVEPSVVAFGHIHESHGREFIQHIDYVNASCLNEKYLPVTPRDRDWETSIKET